MKPINAPSSSRVFRGLLHSSRTLTSSSAYTYDSNSIYSRIVRIREPDASIVPILDKWVEEGKPIDQVDLYKIIKQLRKFKRCTHALQIAEWMKDKDYVDLSPNHASVQLDLISKVHGLKQAEEYFDNIPNASKILPVYGALLNCYADAKLLQKAEATMQKMRELGYAKPLSYNVMLGLYSGMGQHKKLDTLMKEMEDKDIPFDRFTYNIRLNAYVVSSEIDKMEKLIMKMETDPVVTIDWNTYVVVANGYSKADYLEKALSSLKKAEHLIRDRSRSHAYEILITLYASLGKKDDVYRLWNLHKKLGKFYNGSYLIMICSLAKLDDIDAAEKIYTEWEEGMKSYDPKLPNFLITAYCKKGLLEKAESFLNMLMESGKEPNASTWSRMALGYTKIDNMDKAVEAIKKAVLASDPASKIHNSTLASCLEYLNKKGDLDEAEEIIRSLKEKNLLTKQLYESLSGTLARNIKI